MPLFGESYSKFKGSDASVIDLKYSTIVVSWGEEQLIRNVSVKTRKTTFIKISNDFATFIVTCNIWKNTVPETTINEILSYNHDTVNFMPHQDSGVYVQKVGGGDASFYIASIVPTNINSPTKQDQLAIEFHSLEAVDASRSMP